MTGNSCWPPMFWPCLHSPSSGHSQKNFRCWFGKRNFFSWLSENEKEARAGIELTTAASSQPGRPNCRSDHSAGKIPNFLEMKTKDSHCGYSTVTCMRLESRTDTYAYGRADLGCTCLRVFTGKLKSQCHDTLRFSSHYHLRKNSGGHARQILMAKLHGWSHFIMQSLSTCGRPDRGPQHQCDTCRWHFLLMHSKKKKSKASWQRCLRIPPFPHHTQLVA